MNKRVTYMVINLIFFVIAAFYLMQEVMYSKSLSLSLSLDIRTLGIIFLVILGFFMVHFLKMLRLYFVLIEQKLELFRFIKVYFKTTFVNIMIPFKLGELFRIYCFSYETKNMEIGVLCIIMDRFFDTVGLLFLIIPLEIILIGKLSVLSIILLIAILLLIFLYSIFLPTYLYLNKFLVMNGGSARSLILLHGLEQVKSWYDYSKELIKGRYAIIVIISLLGWIAEEGVLYGISFLIGQKFSFISFTQYLQAIFLQNTSWLLSFYSVFGALLLAIVTGIIYAISFLRKRGKFNA